MTYYVKEWRACLMLTIFIYFSFTKSTIKWLCTTNGIIPSKFHYIFGIFEWSTKWMNFNKFFNLLLQLELNIE